MKKMYSVVFVLSLVVMMESAYAQYRVSRWSYGIGGGFFSGQMATSANKIQPAGAAFVRYTAARGVRLELNVAAGQLAGKNRTVYKTTIIPVSVRLLYNSPWRLGSVYPYAYVGAGVLQFQGQRVAGGPVFRTSPKSKGIAGYFPGGVGFQVRLSNSLLLEGSGGFNFTLNDNIDYYFKRDARDAFWSGTLGLTYNLRELVRRKK